MRTIGLVITLVTICCAAMAADFSGQWKGQIGEREIAFLFKTDAGKLTGTVTGMIGRPLDIQDGKVQSDSLSFYVNSEWQGNPVKLVYKGKLSGNEIQFTVQSEGGDWSQDFTAKRAS
jgi:hypothetical protein